MAVAAGPSVLPPAQFNFRRTPTAAVHALKPPQPETPSSLAPPAPYQPIPLPPVQAPHPVVVETIEMAPPPECVMDDAVVAEAAAVVVADPPLINPAEKPKKRSPPKAPKSRHDKSAKASMLSKQCGPPPAAQMCRFEDALRSDERSQYLLAAVEFRVIEVAFRGCVPGKLGKTAAAGAEAAVVPSAAVYIERAACAADNVPLGDGTKEKVAHAAAVSAVTSYFADMVGASKSRNGNSHNSAADYYCAEKQMMGVHRTQYTPLEQAELEHLRELEKRASKAGKPLKLFKKKDKSAASAERRKGSEAEEKRKQEFQQEKLGIFAEQERVLSGKWAEEEVLRAQTEERVVQCAIGKLSEGARATSTVLWQSDINTAYNIDRYTDLEKKVCAQRLVDEHRKQQARVDDGKQKLTAEELGVVGGGRRRGKRPLDESLYQLDKFTVVPKPAKPRVSHKQKAQEA